MFEVDNVDGYVDPESKSSVPKKKRSIVIRGLGLPVMSHTPTGMPQCNSAVSRI